MNLMAVLFIFFGYFLGSFPSAYLAGCLLKRVDVRKVGDGNMGAANVFREIGPRAGVAVALADVAKGSVAVLLTKWIGAPQYVVLLTGVAAVAGHNWPVFLQFKGGRGVSTALGVLLVLLPWEMFILVGAAAVPLFLTGNMILTCAVLFAPLPLVAWWLGAPGFLIAYGIGLPCLVGFTHFLTTRHASAEIVHPENNAPVNHS